MHIFFPTMPSRGVARDLVGGVIGEGNQEEEVWDLEGWGDVCEAGRVEEGRKGGRRRRAGRRKGIH